MNLWEFDGGKQYSGEQGSWSCPPPLQLDYTCPPACLTPPPPRVLPRAKLCQGPQSSLSAVSKPEYLPSLAFLSPPLRKTEQVTFFPWLHTHTQHFPLQGFWPLLIVSTLRKRVRGGVMHHHPTSLPMFLGIVLRHPLPASCPFPPTILQGLRSLPSPKLGSPGKGRALQEPCGNRVDERAAIDLSGAV